MIFNDKKLLFIKEI